MEAARVAMWSGPRNISTAMMRSFGARADTLVVDEPLYAHYLAVTGLDHPGRDQILASQPTSWRAVAAALTGPLPDGVRVYYQKHMAHHLLPDVGREWLGALAHAHLIRDPAHVVASYAKVRGEPTLADIGLPQQREIFERHGGPVVDAADVLRDPEGMLRALCGALGVAWDPAMLSWPPGPRATDGVWAPHWYAGVEASTGFARPGSAPSPGSAVSDRPPAASDRSAPPAVPDRLAPLVEAARPHYEALARHRLRPS